MVNRLLRRLLERRQHLVMVIDEFGGLAGLVTLEDVLDNTGFEFDWTPDVPATPAPPDDWLAALRGPIAAELAATYPRFAEAVFGAANGDR